MKKALIGLTMVLGALLLTVPVAMAGYPVSAGDSIIITDGIGGSNGYGGGAFNIDLVGDSKGVLFDTFCLERNEYITLGQEYYIASITDYAVKGGLSGGNPDLLSSQAAWLYSQWATKAIQHTPDNADALQLAIWKYEGEWETMPALTDQAAIYYTKAASMTSGNYGVKVMNLTKNGVDSQSQLIYVPEPAALLLLGFGLVGLAGARKKFKK